MVNIHGEYMVVIMVNIHGEVIMVNIHGEHMVKFLWYTYMVNI